MDWFMGKGRRKDKDAPLAPQDSDNKRYLEEELSSEKVLDADWEKLTRLPPDIDKNEWLATHTLSFFDHINMIYSSVSEFCTATGCSSMTGPGNTIYQWLDEKGKKVKCAAPQYVEYVMTFAKKTLHDENVFPTKFGNDFPPSFDATVKKIHRLLFHVIAHLFQAHYKEMVVLRMHPHLNTLFEHFVTFSRQFSLVEDKQTELLDDLYQKLRFAGASLQNKDNSVSENLGVTGSSEQLGTTALPVSGSDSDDRGLRSHSQDKIDSTASVVPSDRLSTSSNPVIRPTTLPCSQEYQQHATRHSANGSAGGTGCHHGNSQPHDDSNKENHINVCDSNQSQQMST